jgi:hypothetical protein
MLIPNERWASGHLAWEAAPDLSYYAYRYEIEWQDRVYGDVSFSAVSDQARLLRCELVNDTDLAQNLMLHLVAYMNFPPVRPYSDEPIQLMKVSLPVGGLWIDGLDYHGLQFAIGRPTDNLVPDGMLRAEVRDNGLVDGSGIGCGFGNDSGDWVLYHLALDRPLHQATLTLRYRLDGSGTPHFRLDGIVNKEIELAGDSQDNFGFTCLVVPVGSLESGEHSLLLTSLGGGRIELDGLALTEINDADDVHFDIHTWSFAPEIIPGPHPNSILLEYADTETTYGLAWDHPDFGIRQLFNDELDTLLPYLVPNNYSDVVHGPGEGHFTDVFLRPIVVPPQSKSVVFALVCAGSRPEVEAALSEFARQTAGELEASYSSACRKLISTNCLPAGETYEFSQKRMAATELMNVVYPVYTRRQYIRHNTPGKWWDCLYTWDSGFIGLALLELDLQRAVDCLNAYVTEVGDSHAAFVHHGSPVPTQIYLFHELWNRTQDRALLEIYYPPLRQYYLFMVGRLGSSTTRSLNSNLLRTWEYFFDSGGWDDYPAQAYMLEKRIESRTTCVVITAHMIRCAKILRAAAESLGIQEDQVLYEEDIAIFSNALQNYAWDQEVGYFSYVRHDDMGNPVGVLRHDSGENFNMGLDGVMPLVAGICTVEQEALLLDRLADPKRLWSTIGISTVDQSAPYYRKDGYWNGAVWMPYQWFIWKTALDLGQGDFAYQIAKTALDLWKTEVEASYYCFEHFLIQSGRGAALAG